MKKIIICSFFACLSFLVFVACETIKDFPLEMFGSECTNNVNVRGVCNRDEACINDSCVVLSAYCPEDNGENTNSFGYCLEGFICKNAQCVDSSLSCTSDNDCNLNMECRDSLCRCKIDFADCDKTQEGCETKLSDLHKFDCNTCETDYGDCDNDPINGCETRLSSLSYDMRCNECREGYADCNNEAHDGCETRLSDLYYTSCGVCIDGYADCDNNPTNGCETRLSDLYYTSCGVCIDGHADCDASIAGCETRLSDLYYTSCGVCIDGHADCDNNPTNGCETRLSDLYYASCGVCIGGHADCDNNPTNGCETRLSDLYYASCGVCIDGHADCDNNPANGCEINLLTNPEHCGWCNNKCDRCSTGFCICDETTCAPGEHCESVNFRNTCRCGTMGIACGEYNQNQACVSLHYCDARGAGTCKCKVFGDYIDCSTGCSGFECIGSPPEDERFPNQFEFIFSAWIKSLGMTNGYSSQICRK